MHFGAIKHEVTYKLLLLPTKHGRQTLDPAEIVYIRSDANYCHIISASGAKYIVRITITEMEQRIIRFATHGVHFKRIHERYIISLRNLLFDKQMTEATLCNGEIVPISERYRGSLSENFEVF